jgi:hypothetical protein
MAVLCPEREQHLNFKVVIPCEPLISELLIRLHGVNGAGNAPAAVKESLLSQ